MADWKPPTQDRVEGYFKELNNWGRWGHDDQRGTAAPPPQLGQMCLAAAWRAIKHQDARRPGWPSLDPAERRRVAIGNDKVRAAERRPVG